MINMWRWIPMYVVGGLGIGQMIAGNWKNAAIFLAVTFGITFVNRIADILIDYKQKPLI